MTQYLADPGTEQYIIFARNKLALWKAEAARAGVGTVHKRVDVSDGSTIYVDSTALGQGRYNDRIRITGGGYKYIVLLSVPVSKPLAVPPLTVVSPVSHGSTITFNGAPIGMYNEGITNLPMYASASSAYSYTDEHGVLQVVDNGTVFASWVGIRSNGTDMDGVFIGTWPVPGPYYGLPRYGPGTGHSASIPIAFPTPDTSGYTAAVARYRTALATYYRNYYTASTAALVAQLSGISTPTTALHAALYNAFPEHPDTLKRIPDKCAVSFYYVSTESTSHVWGAFGAPPNGIDEATQADGDEKLYLIPIARVTYDEAAKAFVASDPVRPAVLRDPVEDAKLAAWDWANLLETVRLQQPADNTPAWPRNVVAVFEPSADTVTRLPNGSPENGNPRQSDYYTPQMVDIQTDLRQYPLTSAALCTQLNFVAAATRQPSRYPVSAPP